MTEEHPLAGVRLKLERARHHVETLKEQYRVFCDREPITSSIQRVDEEVTVQVFEDSGERREETRTQEFAVFRFHVKDKPPFAWSSIIGDCLQNARFALEHLAWKLADPRQGGSGPIPFQTGFPILCEYPGSDEAKQAWSRMVGQIGKRAQEEIEALQPYQHWPDTKRDPLWMLHELAHIDRYRILEVSAAMLGGPMLTTLPADSTVVDKVDFAPDYVNPERYEILLQTGGVRLYEDGAELGKMMSGVTPYGKRPVAISGKYLLAFRDAESVTGLPVIETLDYILGYMETHVMARFETFL